MRGCTASSSYATCSARATSRLHTPSTLPHLARNALSCITGGDYESSARNFIRHLAVSWRLCWTLANYISQSRRCTYKEKETMMTDWVQRVLQQIAGSTFLLGRWQFLVLVVDAGGKNKWKKRALCSICSQRAPYCQVRKRRTRK